VLFALDVYRAKLTGHDRKTGGPIFEIGADGHLVRGQSERTLHLMRKSQPGFGSQNWTFGRFDRDDGCGAVQLLRAARAAVLSVLKGGIEGRIP
jgi:hypothetical protein